MNKKQISKRNRFFTWTWQGCLLLGVAGFLMTSCAGDGFADESFVVAGSPERGRPHGDLLSGDYREQPLRYRLCHRLYTLLL